jgi:hypothetical protein
MYKRTKGQCKKITTTHNSSRDSMDHMLELMQKNALPISLVSSPRSRIVELRSIFKAEYPLLEFDTYDESRSKM